MTIRGRCFTNLDDYKLAEWPTRFVRAPVRGERVQATGREPWSLCVVGITHCEDAEGPWLRIELHRG